ncbi:MAG: hypothetical protein AAGJ92_05090 [Pseudomonadota bacterium]
MQDRAGFDFSDRTIPQSIEEPALFTGGQAKPFDCLPFLVEIPSPDGQGAIAEQDLRAQTGLKLCDTEPVDTFLLRALRVRDGRNRTESKIGPSQHPKDQAELGREVQAVIAPL